MIRISLIENDRALLLSCLEAIRMQPDIICNYYSTSAEQFWENLPARTLFDIIFVSTELPDQSSIEILPKLRKNFPCAEIVMLSQKDDPDILFQSLHAGATGYLLKDFNIHQCPGIIRAFSKGESILSPKMARHLINHFRPPQSTLLENLSAKELQILRLFVDGHSYETAGKLMNMKIDNVRYYVKNIYQKLNVHNKLEAIKLLSEY